MSISNGQPVNAAVTNAAFVSRTTDSTVVSKLSLDRSLSGDTIEDAQQSINDLINAGDTLQTQIDDVVTDLSTHESLTAAHGATGEVVGTTNTQTLTNKTLTSPVINTSDIDGGTASNTSRITLPKDTKSNLDLLTRKEGSLVFDTTSGKPYYDNGTDLQLVGSGSGGAVNWINDSDATNAPNNIFSLAKYTAGVRPPATLTSSGSPSITRSIVTVSPEKLFSISHPASNTQGEAFEITDITLPYTAALTPQMVKIRIPYIVDLGTFQAGSPTQDSDLIVYIGYYDSGSSSWKTIEPSNINFLSNVSDVYESSFQTIKNVTQYKILLYCATTTTQSFTILINKPTLAPSQYVYAAPITDWIDYTPTISAESGTLTNYTLSDTKWSRVGSNLYIKGKLTFTGSPGTWTFPTVSYPAGLSAVSAADRFPGMVRFLDFGTNIFAGDVNPKLSGIQISSQRATNGPQIAMGNTLPFTFTTNDFIEWAAGPIQIAGWSSNTQVSDGYDARPVQLEVTGTPTGTISASPTTLNFPTVVTDTVGGYSAGVYTIKTSGFYTVYISGQITSTMTAGFAIGLALFRGATQLPFNYLRVTQTITSTAYGCANSWSGWLNAGETISARGYSDGTSNSAVSGAPWTFSIKKDQAPTTMSATEKVVAKYQNTAGTSIGAGLVQVPFATKDEDTHAAYNGTSYIVPISGQYRVSASLYFASAAWSLSSKNIRFRKSGTAISYLSIYIPAVGYTGELFLGGTDVVTLSAGDSVDFAVIHNEGTARSLGALTGTNRFTIELIK